MGIIVSSNEGKTNTYIKIFSKDDKKGLFVSKGQGQYEKISGLKAHLIDIRLLKDNHPQDGEIIKYEFILKDYEEREDCQYVLQVKEKTRYFERLANLLCSLDHVGELQIFVYESSKVSRSVGIAMRNDNIKVNYKFSNWLDELKTYEGVPADDGSGVRQEFWRKQIFKTTYPKIFGRDYEGDLFFENAAAKDSKESPNAKKYSHLLNKANNTPEEQWEEWWPSACVYIDKAFSLDSMKTKALEARQAILDAKSTTVYVLSLNGKIEIDDDLPF